MHFPIQISTIIKGANVRKATEFQENSGEHNFPSKTTASIEFQLGIFAQSGVNRLYQTIKTKEFKASIFSFQYFFTEGIPLFYGNFPHPICKLFTGLPLNFH